MPFAYKTATISGAIVPGGAVVPLILQIGDFLQNSLGWTLVEDRTAQAGANSKYILKTAGETDANSSIYLVMTSGTNVIGLQYATAWDTGTHAPPASGTITPTLTTTATLAVEETKSATYWISGDKDSVNVITKINATYDAFHFGFITPFNTPANDPFPAYLVGATSSDVDGLAGQGASPFSVLDATTGLVNSTENDWQALYTQPFNSAHAPDNVFGSTERFMCFPMIAGVSDNSPVRRSIRGISKNVWATIGPATTSLFPEDVFLVPSTGRTYQVFYNTSASVTATVIRRS